MPLSKCTFFVEETIIEPCVALEAADVVVAGIPYDGSAVYRKGAALAPQRIRSLSAAVPPVTEDGRLLKGLRLHDLGDLDVHGDAHRHVVGESEPQ